MHVQTHQTPQPSTHVLQGHTLLAVPLNVHHAELASFALKQSRSLFYNYVLFEVKDDVFCQ